MFREEWLGMGLIINLNNDFTSGGTIGSIDPVDGGPIRW